MLNSSFTALLTGALLFASTLPAVATDSMQDLDTRDQRGHGAPHNRMTGMRPGVIEPKLLEGYRGLHIQAIDNNGVAVGSVLNADSEREAVILLPAGYHMERLRTLPGQTAPIPCMINTHGIVGMVMVDDQTCAVKWNYSGMDDPKMLPSLPGRTASIPLAMSLDGRRIVGEVRINKQPKAVVWDSERGPKNTAFSAWTSEQQCLCYQSRWPHRRHG